MQITTPDAWGWPTIGRLRANGPSVDTSHLGGSRSGGGGAPEGRPPWTASIVEAMRLGRLSLALLMVADIASAGTTMESIGAEKCGGRVSAFEVEFLAPESAPLEAT